MGLSTGTATAPALERNDAELLSNRRQTLCQLADERELKVAALREQYRNGTYQVNSAALSAKLVDSLLK